MTLCLILLIIDSNLRKSQMESIMAKAYYSCHRCGTRCQVVGRNRREADRLAEYRKSSETVCTDCYINQQKEESVLDAKANKQDGLPDLQGSESQVLWAESIRKSRIYELSVSLDNMPSEDADYGNRIEAMQWLESQTIASWWIDQRYYSIADIVKKAEYHRSKSKTLELGEATARLENTVYPKGVGKSEVIAEVNLATDAITVRYPAKSELFRELIKFDFSFHWNETHWRKTLTVIDETPKDQVAEIGNKLLDIGIPILIWNEAIRQNAISGSYTPIHTRWISWQTSANKFAIQWARADDLYNESRKIPQSRWSNPYVVAPIESAEEVLAFSECYDFKLTNGARSAIDRYIEIKHNAMIAEIAKPKLSTKVDKSIPKLSASETVIVPDDLLDD